MVAIFARPRFGSDQPVNHGKALVARQAQRHALVTGEQHLKDRKVGGGRPKPPSTNGSQPFVAAQMSVFPNVPGQSASSQGAGSA